MKTYSICLVGLDQRRAVVVGGGRIATQKVAGLLEANARVTVVSPTLTSKLKALAGAGRITVIDRPYRQGDLVGAFVVIAATDDPATNKAIWREAEQRGCLVNVVDDPAHCNFIVPAVVRRGEVTVAISTGGASPALARRLRERLETLVGPEYGDLALLLGELRPELRLRYKDKKARLEAAFRLVDSELVDVVREKGLDEARVQARELLAFGN